MQSVETKHLTSQKLQGETELEIIRNKDTQPTPVFIEGRQSSWWEHLQYVQDTCPVKQISEAY